jgi:hypothetical protein
MSRMRTVSVRSIVVLLAVAGVWAGCIDVRDFEGIWTGRIVSEPAVRQGFTDEAVVDALGLRNVDFEGVTAILTTSDGKFRGTRLTRVVKASNDTLATLTFDGDPLRSYLLFAPLHSDKEGWPASMVISLFADDHVELRILRGNDLFGVFFLSRRE